ncbi:Protein yippee-like 2 [Myotis davidii]|uniref:Protein yippee-like 2 n=1 Tax=Myotis davidii TaxID=225400 RepID=L5LGD8_MYODS|nr:Protein yippee-like 2 [Myotis davidii]
MVKMTRSKTFQAYLPSCHRTYSCIHCRAHLANHDELISKLLSFLLFLLQPVPSFLLRHLTRVVSDAVDLTGTPECGSLDGGGCVSEGRQDSVLLALEECLQA